MRELTEDEKILLQKLTVRTANINDEDCSHYNLGSGTIIGSGEKYYVLTAGHCVDGVDIDKINVEAFDGNRFSSVTIKDVVYSVYKKETKEDYAVLEIDNPNNGIDYNQIIKRFDLTIKEDRYFMLSYPPLSARDGRIFEVRKNSGDYWQVYADVNYSLDDFKSLINGSSGAGIFVYRHNRFYYVGIAIATRDDAGRFNDVLVLKPNVFDGIIPDDTKDNNFFDTLKTWEEWSDGLTVQQRREIIRKMNVDWLDYLTRKAQVLFPAESDKKVDAYIECYIKGMTILAQYLESNPAFVRELNKDNDKFFKRLIKTHKEYFDTSDGAHQDLQLIIQDLKKIVSKRFPEDKDDIIASDYAFYRVAEKLLNCQLKYYPKV